MDGMKTEEFLITQVYDTLLRAVHTYRMLTVVQATRLLYKLSSATTVSTRLKTLAEHGYLLRISLPTTNGQAPLVYMLASLGIRYLEQGGSDVTSRYRRVEQQEKSYLFLMHTLAVNDVLIASAKLPAVASHITLFEMQHEHILKQTPLSVTISKYEVDGTTGTQRLSVIPDGWLDFRISRDGKKERRASIWLEVDRGTIEAKQFKRKLRGILAAIETGKYTEMFKAKAVTVAFATTSGERRVEQMRSWTREALAITHEKGYISEMFMFTALPETIDPFTLFCTPVWYTPFKDKEAVALLS
jgi:hypothetical protein